MKKILRLFQSKKVPFKFKLIPLVAVLYALSPVDLIPDVFLGLGQVDDVVLILIALQLFSSLANNFINRLPHKAQKSTTKEKFEFEEGVILE